MFGVTRGFLTCSLTCRRVCVGGLDPQTTEEGDGQDSAGFP